MLISEPEQRWAQTCVACRLLPRHVHPAYVESLRWTSILSLCDRLSNIRIQHCLLAAVAVRMSQITFVIHSTRVGQAENSDLGIGIVREGAEAEHCQIPVK